MCEALTWDMNLLVTHFDLYLLLGYTAMLPSEEVVMDNSLADLSRIHL